MFDFIVTRGIMREFREIFELEIELSFRAEHSVIPHNPYSRSPGHQPPLSNKDKITEGRMNNQLKQMKT